MIEKELKGIRETAKESIKQIEEHQTGAFSAEVQVDFISRSMAIKDHDHYKVFPDDAKQIIAAIQLKRGISDCKIFLRIVLLRAIILTLNENFIKQLPYRVLKFQLSHLKRIASDMRTEEEWLDISHDIFHKEFGIVTLRLLSEVGS